MKTVRLGALLAAVVAIAAAAAVIGQGSDGAQAAPAVQPDTAAEIRIDLGGSVGQTTIEATSTPSGYLSLICLNSAIQVSKLRSLMSSIFSHP